MRVAIPVMIENAVMGASFQAERPGSGDGEREASMTRQMPYEPLPASVLFALVPALVVLMNQ